MTQRRFILLWSWNGQEPFMYTAEKDGRFFAISNPAYAGEWIEDVIAQGALIGAVTSRERLSAWLNRVD